MRGYVCIANLESLTVDVPALKWATNVAHMTRPEAMDFACYVYECFDGPETQGTYPEMMNDYRLCAADGTWMCLDCETTPVIGQGCECDYAKV